MTEGELPRIGARMAFEVCERFDIGDDARKLLKPEASPLQYLELLKGKKLLTAAIQFLAHALPKREAVFWACVCARSAGTFPDSAALRAAETWVADPSEKNRRAGQSAALADGVHTAAGCAAMAAFVSGGSLGPPEAPPAPPAEHLTSSNVAGAVLFAAIAKGGGERMSEHLSQFLESGLEVARGTSSWSSRR
ncbi:MAG: DUF6931 family protein [Acidithiobacillales bacterium]